MMLIGVGFDLVDLASFRDLYSQPDTDLARVFSIQEISDAGHGADRFLHLAARFAAKEAALKALGCGLQDSIALTDVVVVRQETGAPRLEMSGGALQEARRLGVDGWLLSITHLDSMAGAVAIAFSTGPRKAIRRASRSASTRPPRR
jgi:holo-[acyl-carrier protein] synthase